MAVIHERQFQSAKQAQDWINTTGSALPGWSLLYIYFDPASYSHVVWYNATS